MKKVILWICFFFTAVGLVGIENSTYEKYLIVKFLLNQNELKKAETEIDLFLKKHPDDPFLLTEKSLILMTIKDDNKGALEFIKKSIEIYPNYYYSNYLMASILFSEYKKNKNTNKNKEPGQNQLLLDQSLKYLEISIKDYDKFFSSYMLAGVILTEKDEYKKSNEYFERANNLTPSIEAYHYMTLNYRKLNDKEGEIRSYKKILELNPFDFDALNHLSQIYLIKRDFKNASIFLEKLFSENPKNKSIYFKYLYSLFASGENEKFLEVSTTVDISDSPPIMYAKALILSGKKRYKEALNLLNSIKNKNIRSKLLMTNIFYQKQDYFQSFQILRKIEKKNRDFHYYSLMFEVLSVLNLNKQIIETYHIVKSQKDIYQKLHLNHYYIIFEAFGNLNKTDKILTVTPNLKNKSKKIQETMNDLMDTVKDFLNKETIEPGKIKHDTSKFLLIGFYKNQKKFSQARSMIKTILKKNKNQHIYLQLCDVYLQQKNYNKVEGLLNKIKKRYPKSLEVKNFLAYFLVLQNKHLDLALKLSKDTLTKDSENPAYIDTYGYILFKMGRIKEPAEYLKRAYKKLPLEAEIMDHLVEYYTLTKEKSKIIKIYQTAIDNDVDFKNEVIKKLNHVKHKKSQ